MFIQNHMKVLDICYYYHILYHYNSKFVKLFIQININLYRVLFILQLYLFVFIIYKYH